MNMLRSGHGLGQLVTDSIEPARGRRYPPGAVRFRSNQARQFAGMGPVMPGGAATGGLHFSDKPEMGAGDGPVPDGTSRGGDVDFVRRPDA